MVYNCLLLCRVWVQTTCAQVHGVSITICLWNVSALVLASIQILHSHQSGSSFILEARGQLILHHSLFFWTRSTMGKNLGTLNLYILSKLFLVKHCCKLFSDSNFSKWVLYWMVYLKCLSMSLYISTPFSSCWLSEIWTAIMEFLHFPEYPF